MSTNAERQKRYRDRKNMKIKAWNRTKTFLEKIDDYNLEQVKAKLIEVAESIEDVQLLIKSSMFN